MIFFVLHIFYCCTSVYMGTAGTELEEDRGERKVIDEEDQRYRPKTEMNAGFPWGFNSCLTIGTMHKQEALLWRKVDTEGLGQMAPDVTKLQHLLLLRVLRQ